MSDAPSKGDTVVVTVTGVVEEANAAMVTLRNAYGESSFLTHTCTSVEVVKKADPYPPGKLYRDQLGRLFYRTKDSTDYWMALDTSGFVDWEADPAFPLTEQFTQHAFIPPF